MRLPRVTVAAAAACLLLVTGCAGEASTPEDIPAIISATPTPTTTPEPSASATADPEPEDKEPVISTAGFGDVKLGAPVPDGLDYATWVPDYCPDGGVFAKAGTKYEDRYDYLVYTGKFDEPKADVLGITMLSDAFETPSGVHVGQSLDTVKATLPQMKRIQTDFDASKLYVVKDDLGQLTFEFAEGKLQVISSLANDIEPSQIWYSDAAAICGA